MTMKKQKTLHRFAAVAAVLIAFCLVFIVPVGAIDVSTQGELINALSDNDDVINIKSKITLSSTVTITRTVTIDGGNYLINAENNVGSLFNVDASSSPTEITVRFKNMNLENNKASDYRCIATRSGDINLIVEDSVLSSTGNNAQVLLIGKSGSTNLDVDLKNVKITA